MRIFKCSLLVMKTNLSIVVMIVLCACLFSCGKPVLKKHYVKSAQNPFDLMMDRLSFEEFEQEIIKHPELINHKDPSPNIPESSRGSILSGAAILMKTNHVKMLISHGADVDEAIDWNSKYGSTNAIELLIKISREIKKQ
ncbi:MAG: hypothetical protein PHI84_02255 [Kiritimatiellae bacterium]|nr:hypothetical protein [Kiritimatiellia bacterium]